MTAKISAARAKADRPMNAFEVAHAARQASIEAQQAKAKEAAEALTKRASANPLDPSFFIKKPAKTPSDERRDAERAARAARASRIDLAPRAFNVYSRA